MAPNFSKNAILFGTVDYFCLVCETHLKSERDTDVHISKPVHQKLLEAIQYVEEFKTEGIKKIKNKYFCELCNKILSMQARVRLHVTEQTHIDNRNKNSVKRVGNYVIAFEKVAICDQSWNGLNGNSCAICNIEYENEEIHRNEPTHILNVIQIQLEIDSEQNIYRKIDEYSFHCLTCNSLLGLNSLTSHVGTEEHKKLYKTCCDAYTKDLRTKSETIKNESTKAELKSVPSDKVSDFISKSEVKPEVKPEVKYEVKPEIKPEVKPEVKPEIKPEVKPEGNINNLKSSCISCKAKIDIPINVYDENEEAICKALGCVDYITRDESNRVWCILCDNVMSVANSKTHANERHHQIILKLHKKRLHKMKSNNVSGKEENKEVDKEDERQDNNNKKDSDDILEKLNDFQKDDIQINFESNTVFCKKCKIHLGFVCETIETHILEHKKNEAEPKIFDLKVTDTKKTLFTSPVHIKRDKDEGNKNVIANKNEESKKNVIANKNEESKKNVIANKNEESKKNVIANKNEESKKNVIANKNEESKQNETTIKNETQIKNETSNTKDIMKAENVICEKTTNTSAVNSNNDKENIPKNAETKEIKSIGTIRVSNPKPKKPKAVKLLRVPLKTFIQNCEAAQHMMFKDIIINQKYCLNFLCFCFLEQFGPDTFRCQVCEVCIRGSQFDEHMDSPRHAAAMTDTPVILNDDTEFLREIRPGSFHCGFCNWIEPSWEDISGHLKSSSHKESKNSATWRKDLYAAQIERQGTETLRVDNAIVDALISHFL